MDTIRLYSSLGGSDGILKTSAQIDRAAVGENYRRLLSYVRSVSPDADGIAVVKADAYAHSNEICAPALAEAGCRRFAVSSVTEAVALRNILDSRGYRDVSITVLGYTPPAYEDLLYLYKITQCVYSYEYARSLSKVLEGEIDVDIKLDTGMNRLGIGVRDDESVRAAADEIIKISKLKNLKIHGMFSHFPVSDEDTDAHNAFTRRQYELFTAVDAELKKRGLDIGFKHICNSAGALRFPEYALDGVRFGLSLYGYGEGADELGLKPVMQLETVVSFVHDLKKGERVGYGLDFEADRDMKLITMPIGYADGFLRAYGGAEVIVITKKGEFRARLCGRICMDQCMADATGYEVSPGDRVIVFGREREMLCELAKRAGTIDYETLCLISARVPRIPKN